MNKEDDMTANIKTALPGPKSKELLLKKEKYVPKAMDAMAPFIIAKAQGAWIEDVDGNRFLDLTGGWGCLNVGHAHPKVVKAVQEQAEKFLHTDYSVVSYDLYAELARRLVKYAPGSTPKQAAFFNSGAEAVENAVKIARAYTRRGAVVVFEGAFHGRTLLTMTMTHKAKPYKYHYGPFAPDVYRVSYPNPYRNPIEWKAIEKQITWLVNPDEIACVVVEPIQGEGGFVVPTDDFLPGLRKFTKENGILLVVDEVQAGIGRTGKFFAHEHWGIEADLIAVGKSLASGLPLSGVIGLQPIYDSILDSAIGGTYVGNPVACAAALAVLDVIEEEKLLDKAVKLGRLMKDRFSVIQEKHALVGDVRGVGAMTAIEFVKDRKTKEPAGEETAQIVKEAIYQGVLIAKAGLSGNVIRMLIPLVIEENDLMFGLDVLEKSLERVR
jgi:4-aminobutyrate aminotransferase/(S)-3-amino-2-methylpropionate transaminase